MTQHKKLDYSLKTAAERTKFVDELLPTLTEEQLKNDKYIEILSNYIVSAMTPEEKKEKLILTENRMVTINKRETSMQRIVDSLENGEDGLWHMIIENDKNYQLKDEDAMSEYEKKFRALSQPIYRIKVKKGD